LWVVVIATKLVPAVLLPFLAIRRAWGALLVGAVMTAAFVALPGLVGGPDAMGHQQAWWDGVVTERFATDVNAARLRTDFTLGGQLGRWFDDPRPRQFLLALPLVLTVLIDVLRRHVRDGAPVALYLAAIPLVLPISEMHHFIWLLPALLTAVLRWGWGPTRGRDALALGLVVYVALHVAGRFDPLGPWYAGACVVAWVLAAGCLRPLTKPEPAG